MALETKFCKCIKAVQRSPGLRKSMSKKARESAAIAICVKSVLQTRGKTLKSFTCRKKMKLTTRKFKGKK